MKNSKNNRIRFQKGSRFPILVMILVLALYIGLNVAVYYEVEAMRNTQVDYYIDLECNGLQIAQRDIQRVTDYWVKNAENPTPQKELEQYLVSDIMPSYELGGSKFWFLEKEGQVLYCRNTTSKEDIANIVQMQQDHGSFDSATLSSDIVYDYVEVELNGTTYHIGYFVSKDYILNVYGTNQYIIVFVGIVAIIEMIAVMICLGYIISHYGSAVKIRGLHEDIVKRNQQIEELYEENEKSEEQSETGYVRKVQDSKFFYTILDLLDHKPDIDYCITLLRFTDDGITSERYLQIEHLMYGCVFTLLDDHHILVRLVEGAYAILSINDNENYEQLSEQIHDAMCYIAVKQRVNFEWCVKKKDATLPAYDLYRQATEEMTHEV